MVTAGLPTAGEVSSPDCICVVDVEAAIDTGIGGAILSGSA